VDIKTGQAWRNKKTEQEYKVAQVASQITEIERPATRWCQAGRLKKFNGEPLHLCLTGYYIKSGMELGELVFYEGDTGKWARTKTDFENCFELQG
jgi:hypothetical protein